MAGVAGIWYRDRLLAAGPWGILIFLLSIAAVVIALWCVVEWAWSARPAVQFKRMTNKGHKLITEFRECRQDGSQRERFGAAVQDMRQLSHELSKMRVHLLVVGTESDDPSEIAEASKENEDNLDLLVSLMNEGNLRNAREVSVSSVSRN